MKLNMPEQNSIEKRHLILYIAIAIICIISLLIAFYVQFYARIDIGKLVGISEEKDFGKKTEEERELIKEEFESMFTNSIELSENQGENESKKVDKNKKLVYTDYEKKESKLNSYDIEVHIPQINIENDSVQQFNEGIKKDFLGKTESVLNSENKNIIYTVEYVANVHEDILSIIVRSNLKEGSKAQRVIIQTFNYDLRNNKEVKLEEFLKIKQLKEDVVKQNIKEEITKAQSNVEALKELGYEIYNRDVSSDMYSIEKTTEFYITNDTLYIIYAYGNNALTSEKDLIII